MCLCKHFCITFKSSFSLSCVLLFVFFLFSTLPNSFPFFFFFFFFTIDYLCVRIVICEKTSLSRDNWTKIWQREDENKKNLFNNLDARRSTRHRYNYVTLRKINMEKFTRINTLPRIIFIKKKKKIRKEERQKKYR